MSDDYEPGEGYLTDEEREERRPLGKRVRDHLLDGCSIDLFVIAAVFLSVPVWWFS